MGIQAQTWHYNYYGWWSRLSKQLTKSLGSYTTSQPCSNQATADPVPSTQISNYQKPEISQDRAK